MEISVMTNTHRTRRQVVMSWIWGLLLLYLCPDFIYSGITEHNILRLAVGLIAVPLALFAVYRILQVLIVAVSRAWGKRHRP